MSATDSAKQTTSEITTFLKAQSPELKAKIEAIEHFMDHPVAKVGGTLVQDQEFQACIAVLYWVLALVVVPSVLLGESYRVVLTHSARALLRQILS